MRDTIANILGITSTDPGVLTLSKGTFTLRREYYYRRSSPEEFFAPTIAKLQAAGYTVTHTAYGDKFTSFKGGEGVKKNSHYWLMFKLAK
jgi:hypothetical protein